MSHVWMRSYNNVDLGRHRVGAIEYVKSDKTASGNGHWFELRVRAKSEHDKFDTAEALKFTGIKYQCLVYDYDTETEIIKNVYRILCSIPAFAYLERVYEHKLHTNIAALAHNIYSEVHLGKDHG